MDRSIMSNDTPLLRLENVSTHYGQIQALNSVSVDIHAGEIVTLIGANGAGKTSLLMTLCGDPQASSGQIFLVKQNAKQALKLADRGYVIENGKLFCMIGGGHYWKTSRCAKLT